MARKSLRHCKRCRRDTMQTVTVEAMPTAAVVDDLRLLKMIGRTYDRVTFRCPCLEKTQEKRPVDNCSGWF